MNEELRPLPPFIDFCVKILGYEPSVYDDYAKCFTYLECLTYTYTYLKNQIVPTVETQNTVIQEMKDYIDNYFDNLDVQEEINNKLDAMVLDGTLENLLANVISNEWDIYQPYLNEEMGTCIIFKKDDFVMMYDTGYTGQDTLLTNYLTTKGITHLDVLIISHFHGDHAGCMETVLRNYCDSNTDIYIGMIPDYDSFGIDESSSKTRYENFIALCGELELTYSVPINNSTISYPHNISLRFMNTDTNDADDYYNSYSDTNITNYQLSGLNNFSLVCELKTLSNSILFTGDIEQTAETKIKHLIRPVEILMIPHHNWNSYGDKEFFDNTCAKFGFTVRGTAETSFYPYFSRYTYHVRPIKTIQNLNEEIHIKGKDGLIELLSGVDNKTAFDDYSKKILLNFLPEVGHCTFSEVDLYDFTVWNSAYIFTLYGYLRQEVACNYYTGGRFSALDSELREIDTNTSNTSYAFTLTSRFMDFTAGSNAYETFRIYSGYTSAPQKYAAMRNLAYSGKEYSDTNITTAVVRNRPEILAYVSDAGTSNTYIVKLTQESNDPSSNTYVGYWNNLSSNRYLTFMKVQVAFTSSSYTLTYYRVLYDITNNTWTVYNTSPELIKIKV